MLNTETDRELIHQYGNTRHQWPKIIHIPFSMVGT